MVRFLSYSSREERFLTFLDCQMPRRALFWTQAEPGVSGLLRIGWFLIFASLVRIATLGLPD